MMKTEFDTYVCPRRLQDVRWFKYDRDKLWLVYTQVVPVIFEPPCICCSLHAVCCGIAWCRRRVIHSQGLEIEYSELKWMSEEGITWG
jgi:hypothetical protein